MDLSPLSVSGLFLSIQQTRKNPQSMSMRVSLSSLIPAQGLDFCGRIMSAKRGRVYMQCSILIAKEKPAG
jgi:hypothetical protein